ncbi:class I fructose-bisphosphate aldolase [Neobacillus jeddahensis]|uniref:class I fructose-bisphosphate aldolase n=1 Tax=Neobacillus jeddahensis TaxID=1461580 RepID=UPI00058BE6DF|nr:phospho-2-dehydro-3-deoxyheptonate aldolase [Neobacillus jeddahensis]
MSKIRRMSKIFAKDGKSITLALDGYYFSSKTDGIDKTIHLLPKLKELGLDAVIVTYGIAKMHAESFVDLGLIVRADLSTSVFDARIPATTDLLTVEDALKLGADSVIAMTFPGAENEVASHKLSWELAKAADHWNVPFMCETLPYSYHVTSPESNQIDAIAAAARVGTELGADIIKTRLTGEPGDVRIIDAAKRPVLVLGGPKTERIRDYFQYVKHCMDMGAKGVAVGRNITLDDNPLGVVAGLNTIIHQNGTVEEATVVYQNVGLAEPVS